MQFDELEYQLKKYAKKGGKVSRRRQAARVRQFVKFCQGLGIRGLDQIGNRHVHAWYEVDDLAATTLRDRFYAVCLLWALLERGTPPQPKTSV